MASPLVVHELPESFRRPVMILAFTGWNDAAEAATTAARFLARAWNARALAEIDPEEFFHFGLTRPHVRFRAGSETEREIVWPTTEFSIAQSANLPRDIIIGVAPEPHLRWKTYGATVLELARRCRTSLVLTLGALLAGVPHTRPVRLIGGASDPELAIRLGLRPTKYEGPTGIVGVMSAACRDAGLPAASLWANVPHYIAGIENPKAALALVERVLDFLAVTVDLAELSEATRHFEESLREVLAQNAKIAAYVKRLEAASAAEEGTIPDPGELPPSADLMAEIEQFLRQQRPE